MYKSMFLAHISDSC